MVADNSDLHLRIVLEEKQIFINAKIFYFDFKDFYYEVIKKEIQNKIKMQDRLNEMMHIYSQEADKVFSAIERKYPNANSRLRRISTNEAVTSGVSSISASGVLYSGNFPIFKKGYFNNEESRG